MDSSNLLQRVVSGAILIVVSVGATLISQWGFCALLLLIVGGSAWELYRMSSARGCQPQVVMGIVASCVVLALGVDGFYNGSQYNLPMSLFLIVLLPSIFILEITRGEKSPMENIAITLLPLLYVAAPMAMLAGIPLLISGGEWSACVVILYLFITWANDSFAYLIGVSFGRHKIAPSISPKKSWEGFVGGVAGAMGVAALGAHLLGDNLTIWLPIALIISIMGMLGDLVESTFKRSTGIKDSGDLIPGHGGILDRFDALILSAPFVFVYLLIIELLKIR
ncbi:MAG: phosphatidate cytidylyltransferase [Rikenellaceae bacterium]